MQGNHRRSPAKTVQRQWWARQLPSEEETDTLLAEGRVVMLTDEYAPVEQMLAPVFLDQVPK